MKDVLELIIELKNKGIFVRELNGQLQVTGAIASLTEKDKESIRRLKAETITFLKERTTAKKTFDRIPVVEKRESYQLSSSQKRLWVLGQFEEGSIAYNMPGMYVFEGKLNVEELEYAFAVLIERHEILRTVFKENENREVRQYIQDAAALNFKMQVTDLCLADNKDQRLKELMQSELFCVFNMAEGPLIRAHLFRMEKDKWVFCYVIHHIISDGWSMDILVKELLTLYNYKIKGIAGSLKPLSIQYKDYAAWQQQQLTGNQLAIHKDYWLNIFSGEIPVLELPTDKTRPAVKTYNGNIVTKLISKETADEMKALTKQYEGTYFMGLLSAVYALLYRYSGQEDIVIGSPVAGREHMDLEDQIGFYVNTLAFRNRFKGEESFRQLFNATKQVLLGAYDHQVYPFDELVENLELKRDMSRNALFDVMVVMLNTDISISKSVQHMDDVKVSAYDESEGMISKFDLNFLFMEKGDELELSIEYNTDLYEGTTITRMLDHFEQLLKAIISNPEYTVDKYQYLTEKEGNRLLNEFNDTACGYSQNKTLLNLFEEQVTRTPGHIAIDDGKKKYTYEQLDKASDLLAAKLCNKIKPEDIYIAVHQNRTTDMIVSLLAILKSGKAYVPIEPAVPADRKEIILRSIACSVLITDTLNIRSSEELSHLPVDIINVNDPLVQMESSFWTERPQITADDIAYIIFTSGSTGVPKGVIVEHRPVINLIEWVNRMYRVNGSEKLLCTASISFDLSVYDIFGILAAGGCVRIAGNDELKDPASLAAIVYNEGITFWDSAPATIQQLVPFFKENSRTKRCDSLRLVFMSGDWIPLSLPDELKSNFPNAEIIGLGGATEATVWSNYFPIGKIKETWKSIPYGRPIQNAKYYVLDKMLYPVPVGVIGDLYIGGEVLALGYNDKELSAKKFIASPFCENERIYNTGDKARFFEDGNIEFLGRVDDQVKIRGYRIELGEIESVLLQYEAISDVVVVAPKDAAGERYLAAYLISKEQLNSSELRNFLSKKLPLYMIPAHYVQLERFPLTANGKLNKKALPSPEGIGINTGLAYVEPETEDEKILAKIWMQVLGREKISRLDNFFELGGDSIKAIQVTSRLLEYGRSLKVGDVMLSPVLEDLSLKVKKNIIHAEQGIVEGEIPLSPVQAWFFSDDNKDKNFFNQSVLLKSRQLIPEEGIQKIFEALTRHHDALRMSFHPENGNIIQRNNNAARASFSLETADLRQCPEPVAEMGKISQKIQSAGMLDTGPLVRLGLFHMQDGDRLLIVIHHLVTDGVSWRILLEDISSLYDQYTRNEKFMLPKKTDSFKQWVSRLKKYAQQDQLKKELPYWNAIESIKRDPLPLKTETCTEKDSCALSFSLNEEETLLLTTKAGRAYNTDVNDLLIAALSISMRNVFGIGKTALMLEGHGREEIAEGIDVSRTAGWFTSMYPVVISTAANAEAEQQLVHVKETLRQIPGKGIGYGLLKYMNEETAGVLGASQFDAHIMFNYLGDFGNSRSNAGSTPVFGFSDEYHGEEQPESRKRAAPLDVTAILVNGHLTFTIAYGAPQLEKKQVEDLLENCRSLLREMIPRLSEIKEPVLTPCDLTFKKLTQEAVSQIVKKYSPVEDVYLMSPLQQGLYYFWLANPGSVSYVEQMSYRVRSTIDLTIIRSAFQAIVANHAILRTCFTHEFSDDGLQIVRKHAEETLRLENIAGFTADEKEQFIDEYKEKDRREGFALNQGALMRLSLIGLGNDTYEFLWSYHHILMDGWCLGIIINEFFKTYDALVSGKPARIERARPYSDYIRWLDTVDKESSFRYWREYLSGYNSLSQIPPDQPLLKDAGYEPGFARFDLPAEDTKLIREKCIELNITENIFIQTMWGLLLSNYNNKNDVVFGSVVSGRPPELKGVEDMIGLFINTIPVRISIDKEEPLDALLKRTQRKAIDSTPQHYVQLAEIQSESEPGTFLFDHILVFENFPVQELIRKNLEEGSTKDNQFTVLSSGEFEQTNYDLNIIVSPGAQLNFKFSYNKNVYSGECINRLQKHFFSILRSALVNTAQSAAQISCLDKDEQQQLLSGFNNTSAPYPREKTFIDIFEERVKQGPLKTALTFRGKVLNYAELDNAANAFAAYLNKNYSPQPDETIAVKLERSDWLLIVILGVLKSGAAFVPIDLEYPEERVDYMLQHSNSRLLIDEKELNEFLISEKEYASAPAANKSIPQSLAYVIYTSGSTGRPKGVKITHSSLNNYLHWASGYYFEKEEQGNFGLFTSLSFDLTITSLFLSLLRGRQLEIFDPETDVYDILKKYFTSSSADIIKLTPSHLQLVEMMSLGKSAVKKVILGGEKLHEKHINILRSLDAEIEIYNEYGPTEATVGCMIEKIMEGPVTIGKPIANTRMMILDDNLRLSPVGITGELYIAGSGLAAGYLGDEELTASRFIPDPYRPGELMYRTGDLGKWLPDGRIDYTGRKDDQVKIRGHRIELGEIEHALLSYPAIMEALVTVRKDHDGEAELVAYFVSSQAIKQVELRNYLSSLLPVFMIPLYYIKLDQFPLTLNGKINKEQLPSPEGATITRGVEYAAPENETEEQLVSIWSQILGITEPEVGIDHNFFELGGNSIRIIKLSRQISKTFQQEISIPLLFEYTTIRALARFLNNGQQAETIDADFDTEGMTDDLNKFNLINYEDGE